MLPAQSDSTRCICEARAEKPLRVGSSPPLSELCSLVSSAGDAGPALYPASFHQSHHRCAGSEAMASTEIMWARARKCWVGRNSRLTCSNSRARATRRRESKSCPCPWPRPCKNVTAQPLWPASKVTHQSACGMPRLSRLGTYLALHAPRGQASVRSSTPAAAAGEAAGSLHGSHREVRPLSMAGGVYRAGS